MDEKIYIDAFKKAYSSTENLGNCEKWQHLQDYLHATESAWHPFCQGGDVWNIRDQSKEGNGKFHEQEEGHHPQLYGSNAEFLCLDSFAETIITVRYIFWEVIVLSVHRRLSVSPTAACSAAGIITVS